MQHPPDRRSRGEDGTRLFPHRPEFLSGAARDSVSTIFNINILVQLPRPWLKSKASDISRCLRLQPTLKFVFCAKDTHGRYARPGHMYPARLLAYTCSSTTNEWIASSMERNGAKRESAHLQSCRRSLALQPVSDIHVGGQGSTERHVAASLRLLSPGFSSVIAGCALVCIPVFSDSDTTRLIAAVCAAKIALPPCPFKINSPLGSSCCRGLVRIDVALICKPSFFYFL